MITKVSYNICGEVCVCYTRVVEVPVLSASPSLVVVSGVGSGTALVSIMAGGGSPSFFLKFVMIAYSTYIGREGGGGDRERERLT